MSAFNNFIQLELPKRPFTEDDGLEGQVLVRSNNPNKPRELVWKNPSEVFEGSGGGEQNVFVSLTEPSTINSQTVWIQI